jgi:dihydrofolate synthase/folylpolyglutamate synthase
MATDLAAALGRLDALVDWERRSRAQMRVDLAPVGDLLQRLGRPEQRFRSVHVAGTKGKGSVCALVDAGLRAAGWRVGRYASPHLQRPNERIVLGGRPIDDAGLQAVLEAVLDARDAAARDRGAAAQASWFDVLTAAAFLAFAQARLDWAVVEVGLGGRLDSTNVLAPEVAVITNIGLEHTEVLGATPALIAAEKAGIIKPGVPVVTPLSPDSEAGAVVHRIARERAAPLQAVAGVAGATLSQVNRATARVVLDVLGGLGVTSPRRAAPLAAADLPDDVADRARLPARLERIEVGDSDAAVSVVVDGAHVGFALAEVLRELHEQPGLSSPPVVLLALGADKDATAMLAALQGRARHLVCVPQPDGRACWPPATLLDLAAAAGLPGETADSVETGLQRCLDQAAGGWILATGSLHLAAAVRALLGRDASAQR